MKKKEKIDPENPPGELEFFNDSLLADSIHKLKNGLGGIHGFAALLERDFDTADPHMKMVQKIQEAVSKVNDVSTILMDVVRQKELNREAVRMTTLLKQMWGHFQPVDGSGSADLIIDPSITAQKSVIQGDSQLIERMLESVYLFLQSVSGTLERIRLTGGRGRILVLEFIYTPSGDDGNQSLTDYLRHLHQVEPRLALAMIDKTVKMHKGSFNLMVEENRKIMTIEIPKG